MRGCFTTHSVHLALWQPLRRCVLPLSLQMIILTSYGWLPGRSRYRHRNVQRLWFRIIYRFRVFRCCSGIYEWPILDEQSNHCSVCLQKRWQGRKAWNISRAPPRSPSTEKQCLARRSTTSSRTPRIWCPPANAWLSRSIPGPVRWRPCATTATPWLHPSTNYHASPDGNADGPPRHGNAADADATSAGCANVRRCIPAAAATAARVRNSVPSTTTAASVLDSVSALLLIKCVVSYMPTINREN